MVLVIVLTLVLTQKPPYPHTEAQSSAPNVNINNSVEQGKAKAEQAQLKPKRDKASPTPAKRKPIKHPIGCNYYRQLVSKYNWNVQVMLQIMQAESGCNPNAVGDTWAINGLYAPSCGLFQVRTLAGRPSCQSLKDPATNIEWAYKIYKGQGYSAWSVCRTKVSCR